MNIQRWKQITGATVIAGCLALGTTAAAGDEQAFEPRAVMDSVGAERADEIVRNTCAACHGADEGFMGAPSVGSPDDWDWRMEARGLDQLVFNTMRGIGSMPPYGGDTSLDDDEVAAAIIAMMLASDISMDEIDEMP